MADFENMNQMRSVSKPYREHYEGIFRKTDFVEGDIVILNRDKKSEYLKTFEYLLLDEPYKVLKIMTEEGTVHVVDSDNVEHVEPKDCFIKYE